MNARQRSVVEIDCAKARWLSMQGKRREAQALLQPHLREYRANPARVAWLSHDLNPSESAQDQKWNFIAIALLFKELAALESSDPHSQLLALCDLGILVQVAERSLSRRLPVLPPVESSWAERKRWVAQLTRRIIAQQQCFLSPRERAEYFGK